MDFAPQHKSQLSACQPVTKYERGTKSIQKFQILLPMISWLDVVEGLVSES
jgi:hypothetical protein